MFKIIITMRRRPDLTIDQFIAYYNDQHLRNVAEIMAGGESNVNVHRRNFIVSDDPCLSAVGEGRTEPNPPFDVVTEVEFDQRSDGEAFLKAFFDPSYFDEIRADEENFVDLDSIKFFVVDVHENRLRAPLAERV